VLNVIHVFYSSYTPHTSMETSVQVSGR